MHTVLRQPSNTTKWTAPSAFVAKKNSLGNLWTMQPDLYFRDQMLLSQRVYAAEFLWRFLLRKIVICFEWEQSSVNEKRVGHCLWPKQRTDHLIWIKTCGDHLQKLNKIFKGVCFPFLAATWQNKVLFLRLKCCAPLVVCLTQCYSQSSRKPKLSVTSSQKSILVLWHMCFDPSLHDLPKNRFIRKFIRGTFQAKPRKLSNDHNFKKITRLHNPPSFFAKGFHTKDTQCAKKGKHAFVLLPFSPKAVPKAARDLKFTALSSYVLSVFGDFTGFRLMPVHASHFLWWSRGLWCQISNEKSNSQCETEPSYFFARARMQATEKPNWALPSTTGT